MWFVHVKRVFASVGVVFRFASVYVCAYFSYVVHTCIHMYVHTSYM